MVTVLVTRPTGPYMLRTTCRFFPGDGHNHCQYSPRRDGRTELAWVSGMNMQIYVAPVRQFSEAIAAERMTFEFSCKRFVDSGDVRSSRGRLNTKMVTQSHVKPWRMLIVLISTVTAKVIMQNLEPLWIEIGKKRKVSCLIM